jgi:hypothetical protein
VSAGAGAREPYRATPKQRRSAAIAKKFPDLTAVMRIRTDDGRCGKAKHV